MCLVVGSLNARVREPECVGSRVREVADQTAPFVAVYRYHYVDYSVPRPSDSVLRIPLADYQAVPASDPIM